MQQLKAKNTAGAEQTDAASVFFAKARDVLNAPPAYIYIERERETETENSIAVRLHLGSGQLDGPWQRQP